MGLVLAEVVDLPAVLVAQVREALVQEVHLPDQRSTAVLDLKPVRLVVVPVVDQVLAAVAQAGIPLVAAVLWVAVLFLLQWPVPPLRA